MKEERYHAYAWEMSMVITKQFSTNWSVEWKNNYENTSRLCAIWVDFFLERGQSYSMEKGQFFVCFVFQNGNWNNWVSYKI